MYQLKIAYELAVRSPDESTQNGAIIFHDNQPIGQGFNDVPIGLKLTQEIPLKYNVFEHAETYAIHTAWSLPRGGIMYCPWAACPTCARAIILSGITTLVIHFERMIVAEKNWKIEHERDRHNINVGLQMLHDGGVDVLYYHGPVENAPDIKVYGKIWSPEKLKFIEII